MAVEAKAMKDDLTEIYARIRALSPREITKLKRFLGLISTDVFIAFSSSATAR